MESFRTLKVVLCTNVLFSYTVHTVLSTVPENHCKVMDMINKKIITGTAVE